jgi:hypothetical protein
MSTTSSTRNRPAGAGQPGDIGTSTAPFSVSGSCVLSEDYFLTDQVIMNPGDVVRPFARADGTVEALLLSGGALSHLSRSASKTSGWAYTPLSVPSSPPPVTSKIVDVAVGTVPDGTVWALVLSTVTLGNASTAGYSWATLGSSGTWEYLPGGSLGPGLGQVQSGVDPHGNVYFYAFYAAHGSGQASAQGSFALWQPQSSLEATVNASLEGLDVVDARLLWNPGYSASSLGGGVLTLTSQQTLEWHPQTSATGFDWLPNWTDVASALLWTSWSANPVDTDPSYVAQGTDGTVYYTDVQSFRASLAVFPSIGSDQVAVWFKDDLFAFAMLTGETLNVLAQYGDPSINDNQFTLPIPIDQNILGVCGLPSDPNQATLFVTYDDATLSVLTKSPVTDPATGVTTDAWLSVPVQASPEAQELDCWRVQLTVQDANGVPVPGTDLAVTADRPVGIWQASGNTELAAGRPVTLTTDPAGRVTFAFPATELDSAVLSVQLEQNGVPAGNPVTVQPDGDVHAFLAGTGALNDLGTLSTNTTSGATALLQATDASGKPLFPVLASLSGSDRVSASNGVASAINQAMLAGQGVKPGATDTQWFKLDVSQTVPTYAASTSSAGVSAGVESLGSWWDSVKHDAESVYYGVRKGVITVENCVGTWADDAAQWTLNLAIKIGDEISDAVNIVVTDIRSAIHAISGIFHALGADIKTAVNWLRQNVSEIIKEAGQNAKVIEGWLTELPGIVNARLTQYENRADGFFTGLADTVKKDIGDMMTDLDKQNLGDLLGVSEPENAGVGSVALDIEKFLSDVQHNWLLEKILSFYTGETPPGPNADLQAAVNNFVTAAEDAWHFVEDMATGLWDGLKDLFASRDSYEAATFGQLFQVLLDKAVDNLLGFADKVVDGLLNLAKAVMDQLATMLTHEIDLIPVVGKLLQVLGVDDSMSIAHLTSLILMYPATLANRIKNGPGAPLFPAADTAGQLSASADWGPGLTISAAVGQGIWGFADAAADAYKAGGEEAPGMIGWIDIVAPAILNILQWPGAKNSDGSTAPPFANSIDSSGKDGLLILPTWLLGWVPPIAGLCGKFADYTPSAVQRGVGDGGGDEIPEIGQYFTMASAIGATITGSIYNFQTGQGSNTQAAGILGNVSNIIAPFATKELTDSTQGLSDVIKLIVDMAGNIGAAVAMGT